MTKNKKKGKNQKPQGKQQQQQQQQQQPELGAAEDKMQSAEDDLRSESSVSTEGAEPSAVDEACAAAAAGEEMWADCSHLLGQEVKQEHDWKVAASKSSKRGAESVGGQNFGRGANKSSTRGGDGKHSGHVAGSGNQGRGQADERGERGRGQTMNKEGRERGRVGGGRGRGQKCEEDGSRRTVVNGLKLKKEFPVGSGGQRNGPSNESEDMLAKVFEQLESERAKVRSAEEEISRLSERNNRLEQEYTAVCSERKEQSERVHAPSKQSEDQFKLWRTEAEKANKRLEKGLENSNNEKQRLEKELGNSNNEKQRLQGELKKMEAEQQRLWEKLQEMEAEKLRKCEEVQCQTAQINFLHLSLEQEQARANDEKRYLQEQNASLSSDLQQERDRLSSVMSHGISRDPAMVNLNLRIRPDAVQNQYKVLQSGARLDLLELLEDELHCKSQEVLKLLVQVLMTCYEAAREHARVLEAELKKDTVVSVRQDLRQSCGGGAGHVQAIQQAVTSPLGDLLRSESLSLVADCSEWSQYVEKCVSVCWAMQVLAEPLGLWAQEGGSYQSRLANIFPQCPRLDHPVVDFFVWPALVHRDDSAKIVERGEVYISQGLSPQEDFSEKDGAADIDQKDIEPSSSAKSPKDDSLSTSSSKVDSARSEQNPDVESSQSANAGLGNTDDTKQDEQFPRRRQEPAAGACGAQPTTAVDGLLSTAERAKALRTEIDRLLGSYTEELDNSLCKHLESNEKENKRKMKELDQSKAQYSRLNDVCAEYKSQLDKTQAALETKLKQTDKIRDELRETRKRNESLRTDLQQVQEDKERLSSKVQLLQGRVSLLTKELQLHQARFPDAKINSDPVKPASRDGLQPDTKERQTTSGATAVASARTDHIVPRATGTEAKRVSQDYNLLCD